VRIVLVNPPIHHLDHDQVYPPLGLLAIADEALARGHVIQLLDLNLRSCAGDLPPAEEFYSAIVDEIRSFRPDAVGFSSMGSNSHVALLLAGRLKELDPTTITIFGGPHVSGAPTDFLIRFHH